MANILNEQVTGSNYGTFPQVPYGSRLLTIDGAKYIAEDIEVTRPTTVIERLNEYGEPHGQVIIPQFVVGTATLQMPTSSWAPDLGDTFTATFHVSSSAETFMISELGQPESSTTDKKIRISFRKVYGS